MAGIDLMDNPMTNGSMDEGDEAALSHHLKNATDKGYIAGGIGLAGSLASLLAKGIQDTGNYTYNTFFGPRNSVPLGVQLAVGGADKPIDKLNTLKQTYPDATVNKDGDFVFYDPQQGRTMTLNDPGLSMGNLARGLPYISQFAGSTGGSLAGALGGGAAGSGVPFVGNTLGAIGGGAAGGAYGNSYGKEWGLDINKSLANMLGYNSIDSRSPQEIESEKNTNKVWGAIGGAAGPAIQAGKNALITKFLQPNSAELYSQLAEQGFNPSLSQVGSAVGKNVEQSLIENGAQTATQRAIENENLLNEKLSQFLGGKPQSQNELANAFRAGQQSDISGLKSAAQESYANLNFSPDIIPESNSTKNAIANIYRNSGKQVTENAAGGFDVTTPSGASSNPYYNLPNTLDYSFNKILNGTASEVDLQQAQQEITSQLMNGNLSKPLRDSLSNLKQTITGDLTSGNPNLSAAELEARQNWAAYKNNEEDLTNLLGKQSGVTSGVDDTQGLTEQSSLGRAKNLFGQGTKGSTQKSAALSNVLSPEDKNTLLSSMLTEQTPPKSFLNPIEQAGTKYDPQKMAQLMSSPSDQQAFDQLMQSAQGTTNMQNVVPNVGFMNSIKNIPNRIKTNMALNAASKGYGSTNLPSDTLGMSLLTAGAPAIKGSISTPMQYTYPGMGVSNIPSPSSNLDDYRMGPNSGRQPNYSVSLDDVRKLGNPMNYAFQSPMPYANQLANNPNIPISQLGYQNNQPSMVQAPILPPSQNQSDASQKPLTFDQMEQMRNERFNQSKKDNFQNYMQSEIEKLKSTQIQPLTDDQLEAERKAINDRRIPKGGDLSNTDLSPEMQALLKTISSPGLEGADYNSIVGGGKFNDFSHHPHTVGVVTPYGPSTAGGRYQITGSTWDGLQSQNPNLTDFSPYNQDTGASLLASHDYEKRTGRDLQSDLSSGYNNFAQNGDPSMLMNIAYSLNPTWTSLPGGIQQGSGANNFLSSMVNNYSPQSSNQTQLSSLNIPESSQKVFDDTDKLWNSLGLSNAT